VVLTSRGSIAVVVKQPRLVSVVIEVADLERSARLYREGFGLELHSSLHDDDDRWIGGAHAAVSWTDGAFAHFALYAGKGAERTTGAQVGFRVDDLDSAHERAVAAGAEVIHGPIPQPWGRSARYRDFDGNVVELTSAEG
jgi:predicted enzyme related to lactoylglutathione lyase